MFLPLTSYLSNSLTVPATFVVLRIRTGLSGVTCNVPLGLPLPGHTGVTEEGRGPSTRALGSSHGLLEREEPILHSGGRGKDRRDIRVVSKCPSVKINRVYQLPVHSKETGVGKIRYEDEEIDLLHVGTE